MNVRTFDKRGMTFVELMVVVLVFLPVILVSITVFIRSLTMIDLAQNMGRAVFDVQKQINTIETATFAQVTTYDGTSFTSASLTQGKGVCYVETVDTNLLEVVISMSWREKDGRIVGEDLDLDGVLDAGEDRNSNNMLDSPVELTTMVYDL